MKDLKRKHQGSVFPVKLFSTYVLLLASVIENEDRPYYSASFPYGLALSPALVIVILLGIWNFRSMPIFAALWSCIALLLIWENLETYSPRFAADFQPLALLELALVFAVPFVVIYFIWRFWPRKQAVGLPAP